MQNYKDGSYSYVEDYSGSSTAGIVISQKVSLTGGTITMGSNLNYLRQYSNKSNSFNSIPFSVNYSQQFFGGNKENRFEKTLEYNKNVVSIMQYCSNICIIQRQALKYFMNMYLAKLDSALSIKNQHITDTLTYIAKIQLDNGGITEYEYKQIELQGLNNKYAYENAKKNYKVSLQILLTFLGISESENERYIINTPQFNLPVSLDLDVVSSYVNKNNPFELIQEINRIVAEENLYASKLNTRFNGNINLSYGMNQYAETLNAAYRQPDYQQSLKISLQIPVFQWGINKNTLCIAENDYKVSLLSIEKANLEFNNQLKDSVNIYNYNIHLKFIAERAYLLSKEQYEMLVQKFYLGKASVYDLVTVQQEELKAMQKYYTTLNDVWESYFSIRNIAIFDFVKHEELIDMLTVK